MNTVRDISQFKPSRSAGPHFGAVAVEFSCGLRPTQAKRTRDATEAVHAAHDLTSQGLLSRFWTKWCSFPERIRLDGRQNWDLVDLLLLREMNW